MRRERRVVDDVGVCDGERRHVALHDDVGLIVVDVETRRRLVDVVKDLCVETFRLKTGDRREREGIEPDAWRCRRSDRCASATTRRRRPQPCAR